MTHTINSDKMNQAIEVAVKRRFTSFLDNLWDEHKQGWIEEDIAEELERLGINPDLFDTKQLSVLAYNTVYTIAENAMDDSRTIEETIIYELENNREEAA